MSKDLVVRQDGGVQGISDAQVEILRKTLFKKFSDDEIQFALAVCARGGLDPFNKQIHFRKQGDKADIVIITGIDGLRLTASRSGSYAGSDEPENELTADGKRPVKSKVTVYKMVQGQRVPFTATARWEEYYPGDAQGFMWRKMPFTMLEKCAEAKALRKAFPAETSNIYTHEEMHQASSDRTVVQSKADQVNGILNGIPDLEVEALPQGNEPSHIGPGVDDEPQFDDEVFEAKALTSIQEKDLAKSAGFRWNAATKMWTKRITQAEAAQLPFKVERVS